MSALIRSSSSPSSGYSAPVDKGNLALRTEAVCNLDHIVGPAAAQGAGAQRHTVGWQIHRAGQAEQILQRGYHPGQAKYRKRRVVRVDGQAYSQPLRLWGHSL